MIQIKYKDAAEAARDFDHGRDYHINADDLNVDPRRLFRKMIPHLRRRGYSLSYLLSLNAKPISMRDKIKALLNT